MGRRKRQEDNGTALSVLLSVAIKIVVYALIAYIVIKGLRVAYNFGHDVFYDYSVESAPGRDVDVLIPEGTDLSDAAKILEERGLIDNKISFIIKAKFFELEIKPGEYTFNTSESSREMLEMMDDGPKENDE